MNKENFEIIEKKVNFVKIIGLVFAVIALVLLLCLPLVIVDSLLISKELTFLEAVFDERMTIMIGSSVVFMGVMFLGLLFNFPCEIINVFLSVEKNRINAFGNNNEKQKKQIQKQAQNKNKLVITYIVLFVMCFLLGILCSVYGISLIEQEFENFVIVSLGSGSLLGIMFLMIKHTIIMCCNAYLYYICKQIKEENN